MKYINKRVLIISILTVFTILFVCNISFAEQTEYTKNITARANLGNIEEYIEKEINKDGKNYIYDSFKEEKIEKETKTQEYTTEIKELDSDKKDFLNEQFENTIEYEDENYIGTLYLVDYNIEPINNGFTERIDTKEVELSNMPNNDLSQVEKTKQIDGREYVLINVDWKPEENAEIDGTLVPIKYKGTAIYQCIIRNNNPYTYKVSANYSGEIEEKEQLSNYIITYKIKEESKQEDTNFLPKVIIVAGGIIVLTVIAFLLKPNAVIYNVQNGTDLIKICATKLRKEKVIDITNKQNKISGNSFILQVTDSNYKKFLNSTVAVKLNNQKKKIMITSAKNHFSF